MSEDDRLVCNACHYTIRTADDRRLHYNTEWHRYNVKRRCAGLPPIPSSTFSTQLSLLQQKKDAVDVGPKVRTKCNICTKVFNSKASFDSHLLSKKHQKMEKGQKGEEGEEDEEETKSGGEQEEGVEERKEDDEKASSASSNPFALPPSVDSLVTSTEGLSLQPPASSSSSPAPPAELYDGYELQAGEVPIPLLSCVFCPQSFPSISDSVVHMHKLHGFFVPFPSQLASMDGLLTYLGEKVGIGHCCVYCSQRFSSTQAARQHMNEKSHCKMRLDTDDDEDEYGDYYDFDADEKESEGGDNAGEGKRRLTGLTDSGELVLSDGSTIGHRQYAAVYNQNVRVKVEKEAVLAHQEGMGWLERREDKGKGRVGELVAKNAGGVLVLRGGEKESGKRYRESWPAKNQRRLALKIGIRNNIQMHFRAQVQF